MNMKLPSQELAEVPSACWVCGEPTTEHYYGVTIHFKCLCDNYTNPELLLQEVDKMTRRITDG